MGKFRTAPHPEDHAPVRFAWSSDSDGSSTGWRVLNFKVLEPVIEETVDFFIYLGDTVYMDMFGGKAETLGAMRDKYKENRGFQDLRDLLAATSTYAIWDDHEVEDDFDGQTVDPTLLANGIQAFQEYMPIQNWVEDTGFFRTFRWGKDLELFILDERSFRSASVEAICGGDLVPTLPTSIRLQLGGLVPPAPPPGCRAALTHPTRTMLGAVQKALLGAALLQSNATWKVIVNETPIRELFANPYDRWEGYAAERKQLLNFISASGVKNVVFVTGDLHGNIITDVPRSIFTEPAPVTKEFIAGPIAQATIFEEIAAVLGDDPNAAASFVGLLSMVAPADCLQLDKFAYGLVEIDENQLLHVTLKDEDGATLEDQITLGVSCEFTLTPS